MLFSSICSRYLFEPSREDDHLEDGQPQQKSANNTVEIDERNRNEYRRGGETDSVAKNRIFQQILF